VTGGKTIMLLRHVFSIGRATAAIIVIIAFAIVWRVPKWQVASLRNAKGVTAQDVFKAENDARVTCAQIMGGLVVLIGVYFAWQNITATKEGQITGRFYKAI
jgi:mannose/fructose/N-acetylgalactosamine-specific phosphotransferase system component IID